ncbi:MAG: TIGR03087 family PEP-CTERM/XrtA system glycosyltransferase [Hyphomicrobiales bacterium]
MKILYLCHRFPFPPNRGGKIRPFNMIRHLARSHEVVVASIARSDAEAEAGRGLDAHGVTSFMGRIGAAQAVLQMLATVPTTIPASMGYFHSPWLRRRVREAATRDGIELIVVHCSSVAPYVEDLTHLPKLLDFGDMDSEKWLAYARRRGFPHSVVDGLEGIKVRRAENRLARRFDYLTATTPLELATIEERGLGTPASCVPNGVDMEYFSPSPEPYDPDRVVILGRQDYYPNIESTLRFCERILPRVRARRPGVRVVVVGADPVPPVRRLADLPGVTVTGSVPDVRPHVRPAAVSVAPLSIARGTQNKILESMAMGVPVVVSPVAARGVDAVAGEHLLAADGDEAFADAVVRVLGDRAERDRLARAGRERVAARHSWETSMRLLDEAVASCVRRFRERA